MRSTTAYVLITGVAMAFAACRRGAERRSEPAGADSRTPAPRSVDVSGSSAAAAASVEPSRAPRAVKPGQIPFEYPIVGTTGKAGDYVLAPSRTWIDDAFEHGGDKQTFIYYGGYLREPGAVESTVESLTKKTATIPNSLVIPIRRGEKAKPGDVLLTSWASGTGMQRAIVVSGGTAGSPKVRYLDMDLENPSSFGQKEEALPPDTFVRLTKPGQIGTTLACPEGSRKLRVIVTHATGDGAADPLLVLGYGGRIRVVKRGECKALPIVPSLKVGDKAFVPMLGEFIEGKVTKVDPPIGRVTVKYQFGGQSREDGVGYTNVAGEI